MHRIETQRIEVIIRNPFDGIGYEEMPDLVAVRIIEVERRSPWSLVSIREIGGELRR